jgi:hypothetical protein
MCIGVGQGIALVIERVWQKDCLNSHVSSKGCFAGPETGLVFFIQGGIRMSMHRTARSVDTQASKELIRAWLKQRQEHPEPPPALEQIRHQVGWASAETRQDNAKLEQAAVAWGRTLQGP